MNTLLVISVLAVMLSVVSGLGYNSYNSGFPRGNMWNTWGSRRWGGLSSGGWNTGHLGSYKSVLTRHAEVNFTCGNNFSAERTCIYDADNLCIQGGKRAAVGYGSHGGSFGGHIGGGLNRFGGLGSNFGLGSGWRSNSGWRSTGGWNRYGY